MRYKVTKILNDEKCHNIILKHHKEIKPALIGKEEYNLKIRRSSIKLLSEDEKNLIIDNPKRADVYHEQVSVQFAKYNVGDFYEWHNDSWNTGFEELTTIILLNKDFKGGEFQTKINEDQIETYKLKIGESIQFPSEVFHRVKPITKGIRYSITIWNAILKMPGGLSISNLSSGDELAENT
jgi:Rps23 Pro-64 3,4-dihydroxylase Tpa1-like proline 4-hydroxylase